MAKKKKNKKKEEADVRPEVEESPENEVLEEQEDGQGDPVELLKEELQEQKDKYLRLMAEFDNYKRRTSKEYERLVESANEHLMRDIIEVRENFERALSMTDENHEFTKFLEGMTLIFNKLEENLKKNGLTVFTDVGDEFDPAIHDAMMKIPNSEIPEDHIIEIYEKGYTLKNHVIKHAKVIVSSGPPPETDATEKEENEQTGESEEKVTNK